MERNKLARQIIDTCLEMTRLGLNQEPAGNVSVRYQDGMLITPTGIPYEKLTESHIVFIDGNGKHEEGKLLKRVAFPYGGLSKQTGCQRGCSQSCRSLYGSFHS